MKQFRKDVKSVLDESITYYQEYQEIINRNARFSICNRCADREGA